MNRLLSVLILSFALLAGCTKTTTYRVASNGQRSLNPRCQQHARRVVGEFWGLATLDFSMGECGGGN